MPSYPNNNEQFNVLTSVNTCDSTCIVACSYACMQTNMQLAMHDKDVKKCQLGLSVNQINIISIIKDTRLPLSYKNIAEMLNINFQTTLSADAVRGSITRLKNNSFIESQKTSLGKRRGNVYTIKSLACSYIPMINMQDNMQTSQQFNMHPAVHTNTSRFKDRTDSNLSILNPATNQNHQSYKHDFESLSKDDIEFHFENLAKNDFGTDQIRQIILRLESVNISLENVMQGLTYAEWDLEHGQMKDKNGKLIEKPSSWVFKILAKQGYYPRPKNYISPAEQIERDAKTETEALEKLKKEFEDVQYENWRDSLSEEKKQELMEEKKRTEFHNLPAPEYRVLHSCYMDSLKLCES